VGEFLAQSLSIGHQAWAASPPLLDGSSTHAFGCREPYGLLPTMQELQRRLSSAQVASALPCCDTVVLAGRATTVPFTAVLTGHQRTIADNATATSTCTRSLPSQVTSRADLALQAGGRWSRLASALPCPAGRSVPGRGGPERRRRPRPDGTGSTGATLGPHAIRRPRTTPVSSGQSPALFNDAVRPLRRFSQRPSSP
jgi:hypothetical protein